MMGGPSSIRNIHTRELRRIRRDLMQRRKVVGVLTPKLDRTLLRVNRELERRVRASIWEDRQDPRGSDR